MASDLHLHADLKDFLTALVAENVEYLLVGGMAVGFHGIPRFTKDTDILVGGSPENLNRLRAALTAFGAPEGVWTDLSHASQEDVVWMGHPPTRIDLMKWIPGVVFADAYSKRVIVDLDGVSVSVVDRATLIASKRASAREQDLRDAECLEKAGQ